MMATQKLLSEASIRSYLENPSLSVTVLQTVDSTNEAAKRLQTAPALIVSEEQTAGKGRYGKCFYSPRHTGIYMSLATRNEALLTRTLPVTLMVAVAVVEAIRALCPLTPEIKWINDIFLHNQKIGGILVETVLSPDGTPYLGILGIGINLTTEAFPTELRGIASSLGYEIDRNRLIAEIVNRLEQLSQQSEETVRDAYKQYCCMWNKSVTVVQNGKRYTVTVTDVLPDGTLLVQNEAKEKRILSSGEVSLELQ